MNVLSKIETHPFREYLHLTQNYEEKEEEELP